MKVLTHTRLIPPLKPRSIQQDAPTYDTVADRHFPEKDFVIIMDAGNIQLRMKGAVTWPIANNGTFA